MGFSSDVGLGSRFWIELPSAAEPAPAAEVPVLVVSAAADQDLLAEARARGAQACLLKPVDLQQLRQMALSLLGEVV
jgi:CheY-like chemotaxis protein